MTKFGFQTVAILYYCMVAPCNSAFPTEHQDLPTNSHVLANGSSKLPLAFRDLDETINGKCRHGCVQSNRAYMRDSGVPLERQEVICLNPASPKIDPKHIIRDLPNAVG